VITAFDVTESSIPERRRIPAMNVRTIDWARLALKQQVEFFGGDQVSLDSLWRSWGSPAGHDPRIWSGLAAPLIAGFTEYLVNLDGDGRSSDESRLLWIWDDESKDPWRTGDLMSHEFIAWAYATYLDEHGESRETSASHISPSLACR
jgi:hypothetical protein